MPFGSAWQHVAMEPVLLASCAAPAAGQPSKPCLDQGQSEGGGGGAFAFSAVLLFAVVLWVIVMRPGRQRPQ